MSISPIYNYITIVHKSLLQHSYTEHIDTCQNNCQSHNPTFFTIEASIERSPLVPILYLKCGPTTGEQCLVENNSVKPVKFLNLNF